MYHRKDQIVLSRGMREARRLALFVKQRTLYTTPAIVVPVFQGFGPWAPLSSSIALRLHRLKSNPPSEDMARRDLCGLAD